MDIEIKKLDRLGGPGIIAVAVMLVFIILVIILYNSGVGLADEIGIREPDFTDVDISAAPQTVIDDAERLADELAGDDAARRRATVEQLVGSYLAAGEADIVVFFNSGGMGWNYIKDTPGWESILNGITAKLREIGRHPLVINYCRTNRGLWGSVKEALEASTRYTKKVVDAEKRIEFIIDHLPDIQVIITGESTGTVITEETMSYFRDRPNVYSIQTGNPFWYKVRVQERTLRINSNGTCEDAFSFGNVPGMMWSTFKQWVGLTSPEDNPGHILKWLRAPGHHYSWEYSDISTQINAFLEDNFAQPD